MHYDNPKVTRPIDYEIVVAFGPGSHHELTLRDNDICWCVASEPDTGRDSVARFYERRMAPHLDTLDVPEPARDVLRALAAGKTLRQIRKEGIGRH